MESPVSSHIHMGSRNPIQVTRAVQQAFLPMELTHQPQTNSIYEIFERTQTSISSIVRAGDPPKVALDVCPSPVLDILDLGLHSFLSLRYCLAPLTGFAPAGLLPTMELLGGTSKVSPV